MNQHSALIMMGKERGCPNDTYTVISLSVQIVIYYCLFFFIVKILPYFPNVLLFMIVTSIKFLQKCPENEEDQ